MRRVGTVAAGVAAALLIAGCGLLCRGKKEASAPPKVTRVLYKSWKETVDADLEKLTLGRSRTEYKYPTPMSGTPSSWKTVPLPDIPLEPAQAQAIASFVRESGFMDLQPVYGAPEGQRYYPYEITVYLEGGKTQHVLFRSNPEYEAMPEPLKKLETFLKALPQSAAPSSK